MQGMVGFGFSIHHRLHFVFSNESFSEMRLISHFSRRFIQRGAVARIPSANRVRKLVDQSEALAVPRRDHPVLLPSLEGEKK
ncbi:hypothetical protein CEXT_594431 [Caerostris extrusa]|uniref:Uncharacterized protein n=1 Tax=Caerostris extrusa TaxID=172846 RepID=A0AAV4UWP1_CAEEX|nr:hypothetical protein CEXT_594431 [Caerostris extrusa]